MAALEVLVAEDGAAHDGQIRVGADKVMREEGDELQQLGKGGAVDLHGDMLTVEDDAVLVIVNVGGILQEPGLAVDGHRDDAVILTGGEIHPPRVALALPAQQTLGVAALGRIFGGGDGLGILFRLGQVDGNVDLSVAAVHLPPHVLLYPVGPDIIR